MQEKALEAARPAVVLAMRKGRTGKRHSHETRQKMSPAQRARQRADTWAAHEDEMARTLSAKEAATRRSLVAVGEAVQAGLA